MRPAGIFATTVLAVMLAAGCSTATDPAPPQGAGSVAAAQQVQQPSALDGFRVSIPTLGVSSSLVGVGLNPDRTIQVPPLAQPMQAGVYERGPRPGEDGPAVVLAHVNGGGRPGFGAGFHTLAAGDEITVDTPQGTKRFAVTRTQTVDKADFPTREVYSDTDGPELRLVTCGGDLDRSAHSYLSQVIVFARLA